MIDPYTMTFTAVLTSFWIYLTYKMFKPDKQTLYSDNIVQRITYENFNIQKLNANVMLRRDQTSFDREYYEKHYKEDIKYNIRTSLAEDLPITFTEERDRFTGREMMTGSILLAVKQ